MTIYSDNEIQSLIIGKWRYDYAGFVYYDIFKNDFSYEVIGVGKNVITRSITGILGANFLGNWCVRKSTVYMVHDRMPKSLLNLDLLGFKAPLGDYLTVATSTLKPEKMKISYISETSLHFHNGDTFCIAEKIK